MSQTLFKIASRLTSDQKKFIVEIIGTLILVVFTTGSIVVDTNMNGVLGIPFIAIGVYLFGRISMAHFFLAVTLGYLITKHITKI